MTQHKMTQHKMTQQPDTQHFISRQYSIPIRDAVTGGPDKNNGELVDHLKELRASALKRVEASIARLEKSTGKIAVDKIFFDAVQVKDSRAYMIVKILFKLKPSKKRLFIVAGLDKKSTE